MSLENLPPKRIAVMTNFIDFLVTREERVAAVERLGVALQCLDALNLPPVSEQEVEAEVRAARQARRPGH